MSVYYAADWQPLLAAVPYVVPVALVVVGAMVVVRRRRRSKRAVSLYDWSADPLARRDLDGHRAGCQVDPVRMADLLVSGAQIGRLDDLRARLGIEDRRVEAELWPNVIPLHEVARPATQPTDWLPGA